MLDETLEISEEEIPKTKPTPKMRPAPRPSPKPMAKPMPKPMAAAPSPQPVAEAAVDEPEEEPAPKPAAMKPSPTPVLKAGAKPMAKPSSRPAAKAKRPAAVQSADDNDGMTTPAGRAAKPKCFWAAMLLVMTLIFTLLSIGIQYLSMLDKSVAAGIRQPIRNMASAISGIALGPEAAPGIAAKVQKTVQDASSSTEAGKAAAAEIQTLL